MKEGSLLRNLSFCARRLRLSPFNHNPNPTPPPLSLSASTLPTPAPRFFSSGNIPPREPHFAHTQKKNDPIDVEDISNEELKRRVAKLQEGDAEAIPSVFEAILQRYLTGKPIEADQELMREILGKGTGSEDDDEEEEDELDSDLEGMSEIDDEDEDSDLDFEGMSGTNDRQTER